MVAARFTDIIMVTGQYCTDCIDVNAKPSQFNDPHQVLAAHEPEKKKKYRGACLEQHRHFSPRLWSLPMVS